MEPNHKLLAPWVLGEVSQSRAGASGVLSWGSCKTEAILRAGGEVPRLFPSLGAGEEWSVRASCFPGSPPVCSTSGPAVSLQKCPVGNPLTPGLECLVLKSQLNSTYCAPTTCQAALGSSRYQEHQLTALPSRNLLVSGRNRQTNGPITHLNICNDAGKLQALEEGSLTEVASEMSLK